jgi:hypothetical protein
VTKHRVPWVLFEKSGALDQDVWELYDTSSDWTQAKDLAKDLPEKLAELQRLWLIEAAKYNVLPIDDRTMERMNSDLAGRPVAVQAHSQLLLRGTRRLPENVVINVKNKSHSVTAELEVIDDGPAKGVIVAQGGNTGGWSLYAHEGRLKYCCNVVGANYYYVSADEPLTAGSHQVRMEFAYDGGGFGKGGDVSLYLDGKNVGSGRVERTHPFLFSFDETTDVGADLGAPVSEDYAATGNAFSGRVNWVEIDIDEAAKDPDHTVNAEQRFQHAMARQ